MLAADDARVEHGEQEGGERAKHEVHGEVVDGQAAARNRGAKDVYLDGGNDVAGVDKVDEGADLELVADTDVREGRGAVHVEGVRGSGGDEHEFPAQNKRKHDSQPSTRLLVLVMRISRHSFV